MAEHIKDAIAGALVLFFLAAFLFIGWIQPIFGLLGVLFTKLGELFFWLA